MLCPVNLSLRGYRDFGLADIFERGEVNSENCLHLCRVLHLCIVCRMIARDALTVPVIPVGLRGPVYQRTGFLRLSPLMRMTKLGWRLSSEACNPTLIQGNVVSYFE